MSRTIGAAIGRLAARGIRARAPAVAGSVLARSTQASQLPSYLAATRASFTTNRRLAKPLSPEVLKSATQAPLTEPQFHELADEYLDEVLTKYEELSETREDVDVEYSAGVMKISFVEKGDYVINKQPPNKQIWLSSPLSGPKRYDYVLLSEGQQDKQDTATGVWVYLRDGTTLSEVLQKETGIKLDARVLGDAEP